MIKLESVRSPIRTLPRLGKSIHANVMKLAFCHIKQPIRSVVYRVYFAAFRADLELQDSGKKLPENFK